MSGDGLKTSKTLTHSPDSNPISKKKDVTPEPMTYFYPGLKFGVIIPAYNEELNIGNTLARIPHNISDKMEIVVVDDGSVDNTSEIAGKRLTPARSAPA